MCFICFTKTPNVYGVQIHKCIVCLLYLSLGLYSVHCTRNWYSVYQHYYILLIIKRRFRTKSDYLATQAGAERCLQPRGPHILKIRGMTIKSNGIDYLHYLWRGGASRC